MQLIRIVEFNLCNMNKIGFENFRRFTKLEPLEYSGITFLVGRNNSGKSTLVKALVLIDDYLQSGKLLPFSFGLKNWEDANVVTFGRAKNSESTDNLIRFNRTIGNIDLEIFVTGKSDDTIANVFAISIVDDDNGLHYVINNYGNEVLINKTKIPFTAISEVSLAAINQEIEDLQFTIAKSEFKKSSREYLQLVEELNSLKSKRNSLAHGIAEAEKELKEGTDSLYSLKLNFESGLSLSELFNYVIAKGIELHDEEFARIQQGETASENFANLRGFKLDASKIERSFKKVLNSISDNEFVYLGSNPLKQSALFPIREKKNALAQAIHDFFQLKLSAGEIAYDFVTTWMKAFEIGESFEINLFAGEAYEFKVSSYNSPGQLADKGMGSIQAMTLILRLATVIHRCNRVKGKYTVLIEEPEQNLHPALQSKLADMLHEVYVTDGIEFILETHSEYILRRSQVLVAENEYEVEPNENPFCVYYFPSNPKNKPYKMEYDSDGSFIQSFGNGFFDAASSSTLELIKLKRQKQA